jgi:hypothetical protein
VTLIELVGVVVLGYFTVGFLVAVGVHGWSGNLAKHDPGVVLAGYVALVAAWPILLFYEFLCWLRERYGRNRGHQSVTARGQ